jgi:hypothetical protein
VDIDLSRVREFLREKKARRRRRLEERLRQAQEDAGRIIEHFGRRYSPRRIYQWVQRDFRYRYRRRGLVGS